MDDGGGGLWNGCKSWLLTHKRHPNMLMFFVSLPIRERLGKLLWKRKELYSFFSSVREGFKKSDFLNFGV